MAGAEGDDTTIQDAIAEVEGFRATFLEAADRARAAGSEYDEGLVEDVLKRFDGIVEELGKPVTEDVRDNLLGRAEELERLRAYLYPKHEIPLQAKTCFGDMSDWGVPAGVLRGIKADLQADLNSNDLKIQRAALQKLFDYYDNWEPHVTDYDVWRRRTASKLGIALLVVTIAAGVSVWLAVPLLAFVLGGLGGALAGVLGKLPPMLGWGEWAGHTARVLGRIATGLAGTVAGGALFVSGAITIGAPGGKSFGEVLAGPAPTPAIILYVMGLGVLLGFSERALVDFRQRIFQREASSVPEPGEGAPAQ